jgi:hypothetical protein
MGLQLHNMSGPISASSLTVAGNDITGAQDPSAPADRGYKAWSMPVYSVRSAFAVATAGRLNVVRLRRVPAGTITNVVLGVTTAGSSLTAGQCFAALFTAAGVLVGQTADQAAAWVSAGTKIMPLAGGPYSVAAGDYYVGFWFNGTTGPAFTIGGQASSADLTNAGLSAPNLDSALADAGLTTTAPATFGAQTSYVIYWWAAVS